MACTKAPSQQATGLSAGAYTGLSCEKHKLWGIHKGGTEQCKIMRIQAQPSLYRRAHAGLHLARAQARGGKGWCKEVTIEQSPGTDYENWSFLVQRSWRYARARKTTHIAERARASMRYPWSEKLYFAIAFA